MLTPYLLYIKLGLVAALAAALFGACVYVTRDHYLAQIATMKANYEGAYTEAVNLQLSEVQAHQTDLVKGENQHAQDQLTIGSLAFQLAGVQHISGICSSAAKADEASKNSNASSRVAPNRVDAAFAKLQDGNSAIFGSCAQLNIDARQHNVEVGNEP